MDKPNPESKKIVEPHLCAERVREWTRENSDWIALHMKQKRQHLQFSKYTKDTHTCQSSWFLTAFSSNPQL